MSIFPVSLIGATAAADVGALSSSTAAMPTGKSFTDMLLDGAQATSTRIDDADRLVRQFVLDDSVPVHQVTFALEQARLSLELMVQVRTRLLEGYQQLMNMQL